MKQQLLTTLLAAAAFSQVGLGLDASAAPRHKVFLQPRRHAVSRQFNRAPVDANGVKAFAELGQSHKKSPAKRVTEGGMNLYGYLFYSDNYDLDYDYGFYSISSGESELVCPDPVYEQGDMPMDNGWYVDGKVCAYDLEIEYDSDFGYFATAFYYSEMDFATGTVLVSRELSLDDGYMQISAYNSKDGYIYGFGYDFMDNFGIVKAPANNPSEIELVKAVESSGICYSFTFNAIDGKFYGVTLENKFVSITPEGEYTEIAAFDNDVYETSLQCGLAYSPGEQKFYWNPQKSDYTTALATISPSGTVEILYDYEYSDEYTYFFTTDEAVSPDSPKTPKISEISFADGATSGTVTYLLPSEMGNGEAIGSLDWFATLNGALYSSGKSAGGVELPVEYNDLSTGFHTFGLYVQVGDARSNPASKNIFVGIDNPAAPADVVLTPTQVSWSAVTVGANGGYIDAKDIKYEVYLNGELIATTTETGATVDIMEKDFAVYQASVIALSGDKRSEAGESNKLVDGKAMDLPVFFTPTPEQYELMARIDANGDNRGWSYSKYYGCLVTTFSKNGKPMDDWIFLPAVNLDSKDKFYTFGMNASNMGIDYKNEYAEVKAFYGKPDLTAPSVSVLEKFQVGDQKETVGRFRVETPGAWYIGIHCVSDPEQYGIIVKDIYVRDEKIVEDSPAAVSGLTATAHENGVLKATVSFTFPTKTFLGADLDANADLTATVRGENTVTVTGKPGAPATAIVETHQGDNEISVSVAQGENGSPVASCVVYTGVDVPQRIMAMSMEVAPDMMSAELYWDAPTEGLNGGYIDSELVTYEVYREVVSPYGSSGWSKLADCGTTRSYTFVMPEGSEMETVTLGVLAINAAGHCETITYRSKLLGMPYTLPIDEDFEEPETLTYNPWLITYGDNGISYGWGELKLINPDVFPDNVKSALYGRSSVAGTRGCIAMPRFSTKNMSGVSLSIESYAGEFAAPTFITAEYDHIQTPLAIKTLPVNSEGFVTTVIELPEDLMGKDWVQINLESDFPEKTSMMLTTHVNITGKTSGLTDISTAISGVSGEKGGIRILGHDGEYARVFTADGKSVISAECAADTFLPTSPGLYIVRVNGVSTKVIVK